MCFSYHMPAPVIFIFSKNNNFLSSICDNDLDESFLGSEEIDLCYEY